MSEEFWKTKIKITCEEKHEKCHHNVGDSFVYSFNILYGVSKIGSIFCDPEELVSNIYFDARACD